MEQIVSFLRDFNIWTVLIRLVLAGALGAIIGLERSKHGRQAGMRTHILVSIGASLSTLIGCYAAELGFSADPTRIGAQVISGIGFLGAGIILFQNKSRIVGLTTSAGLWNSATIGLAMGIGFYEGALICFALAFVTAVYLSKVEFWLSKNDRHTLVYIEVIDSKYVNSVYKNLREGGYGEIHKLDIVSPRSSASGRVGIQLTITLPQKSDVFDLEESLAALEGIAFAVEL